MKTNHIKLWTGLGAFSLLGAGPVAGATVPAEAVSHLDDLMIAQGGEGGEGEAPSSYRLLSTDPQTFAFDVRPQVRNYADLVHASYMASAQAARDMQAMIGALLENPTEQSLTKAREAWVAARPPYLVTEIFRFYDGPIDVDPRSGKSGPEPHINAWPLNEAFIDAVRGQPNSGLVNDITVELTRESILKRDQVSDEADVSTGWHAIEFLLWGQDFNAEGPGQRPATDYLRGSAATERRRLYLRTVTEMLVTDLGGLAEDWKPDADNYRRRFLALEPSEALGRVLNGMANLAAHELATERLSVALDSGDQEDEHSCFSDTTHQDHRFDLRGVRNAWFGSLDEKPAEQSLRALVLRIDPKLAAETDEALGRASRAVDSMDQPFEKILRAPAGSPPRQRAEAAVTSLVDLGKQLARVGRRLGVLVVVPGLGAATG
ncbi:MAG: imelysin family protein [Panacagrimonas sp.]